MNAPRQITLAREGALSGVGLHTGEPSQVVFRPAAADSGIRFLKDGQRVVETPNSDSQDPLADSLRCSSIGSKEDRILTIEHVLAAVRGLGITNLEIDVHGPELPGLDGSAQDFVRKFKELGLKDQGKAADFYKISEPIFCYDKRKAIAIFPAETFRISYVLDYDHPYLQNQKVDFEWSAGRFEKEIAPARTFCTAEEAEELRRLGFGKGANEENTLIVERDGSHEKKMRMAHECARHKVLDLLGDISLLNIQLLGHVVAIRSGHALNGRLVHEIKKQRKP